MASRILTGSLLLFLVLAVGFRWFGLYHWHDSQRLLQACLLAVVAMLVVVSPALQRSLVAAWRLFMPGRAALAVGLVAVLGIASAATAASVRFAAAEVALLGLLGVCSVAVAAARSVEGPGFDRFALAGIAAAAAAIVAPFVVAWTAGVTSDVGLVPGLLYQSGFSNVRFLGQFHTLALPLLACAFLLPGLRSGYRVAMFLLLAFTWVMAISTATRATWFAWVIGLAIVLPFARGRIVRLLQVQVAALAIGALLAWLMFEVVPRFAVIAGDTVVLASFVGRFGDPLALSMRDLLWIRAVELIAANPLLGVGPMMLALDHNTVATHPHNALLQLAAEWGMPAALLVLAVVAGLWWRLLDALRARCRPPEDSTRAAGDGGVQPVLACALLWALSAAAVHSMVDGLLVMPYAQVLGAFLLGWAVGLLLAGSDAAESGSKGDAPQASVAARMAMLVLVLACSGLLAAGLLPEALRLDEREHAYFDRHPFDQPRKPRLWAQGWLIDDVPARRGTGGPPAQPTR